MIRKLLSILTLLLFVSGAWANWSGSTYTAAADETINATINVSNDATLTINSGVTVTVNGSIIIADDKTLTISGGGRLIVNGNDGGIDNYGDDAFWGDVIINGAIVQATGGNGGRGSDGEDGSDDSDGHVGGEGGYAFNGDVIIYGGTITARGGQGGEGGNGGQGGNSGNGGNGGSGGYAFTGNVKFYGGIVYAYGGNGNDGGEGSNGSPGYASSSTIAFENGVTFCTPNYELTGDIDYDKDVTISSDGDAVPVTAKLANGAYWSTFYSETMAYLAPMGTQVFAVKLDGTTITMIPIEERIVESGHGVVLKQPTDSSEPTTTIVMVANGLPSGFNYEDNSLVGTTTTITNPGNAYVLNYKAATGVGFYKLSATGTIAANKAYLTYSGALAKEYFSFEEDATRVANVNVNDNDNCYYDLQGRCVSNGQWSMVNGQSLKKGLYIVNGKKTVIK